jgi:hypothetical protein
MELSDLGQLCFGMPRYFFHIEDAGQVTDPLGEDLPDENAALEAAEQVACQLAADGTSAADWRIRVTNEAGEKVAEVPAWRRTLH